MIKKDTKIYGSFSQNAGNLGTKLFNLAFKYYNIDAIYKPFSVNSIADAVLAARTLNFSGFAVAMPFKKLVCNHVNGLTKEVTEIGSSNTVINKNGCFVAYNTDYLAAKILIEEKISNCKELIILGNGGYARAVRYASQLLGISHEIITRKNWNDIGDFKNSLIFNCTPVENIKIHNSNEFIDCITTTQTGKKLAMIQASYQFKLYTGLEFPFKEDL